MYYSILCCTICTPASICSTTLIDNHHIFCTRGVHHFSCYTHTRPRVTTTHSLSLYNFPTKTTTRKWYFYHPSLQAIWHWVDRYCTIIRYCTLLFFFLLLKTMPRMSISKLGQKFPISSNTGRKKIWWVGLEVYPKSILLFVVLPKGLWIFMIMSFLFCVFIGKLHNVFSWSWLL